jgi:hypothetical protein
VIPSGLIFKPEDIDIIFPAYLVDEEGNLYVDDNGNYLINS